MKFFKWADKANTMKSDSETQKSRPLNIYSQESELRSELFSQFATRHGAVVLPGRFGGDYNGDRLAYYCSPDGTVHLLLGVIVANHDGSVQLDQNSFGDFVQLSDDWIKVLILSLAVTKKSAEACQVISKAHAENRLKTGLVILNKNSSNELVILPISVPNIQDT